MLGRPTNFPAELERLNQATENVELRQQQLQPPVKPLSEEASTATTGRLPFPPVPKLEQLPSLPPAPTSVPSYPTTGSQVDQHPVGSRHEN